MYRWRWKRRATDRDSCWPWSLWRAGKSRPGGSSSRFATPLRAHLAFYLVAPMAVAEQLAVVAFREWLLDEAAKEASRVAASEIAAS